MVEKNKENIKENVSEDTTPSNVDNITNSEQSVEAEQTATKKETVEIEADNKELASTKTDKNAQCGEGDENPSKSKTVSQATVNKILAKSNREHKKTVKDYQEQINDLKDQQAKLQKTVEQAFIDNTRLKLVNDYGLDNELSTLITGTNKEQMEAQAKIISSRLSKNKGIIKQEGTGSASVPKKEESWLDDILP